MVNQQSRPCCQEVLYAAGFELGCTKPPWLRSLALCMSQNCSCIWNGVQPTIIALDEVAGAGYAPATGRIVSKMTPAFGFSIGDFISLIGMRVWLSEFLMLTKTDLIRKISKALKQTGGACSEYQNVIIELKSLKHTLQHLEALEPTEDNLSHVNAIRGMALACQLPLRDFMTKLEKYENSLGPWAERSAFRGLTRKARWAVGFTEEVEKLGALVAAKQISINLLLATHTS